MRLAWRTLGLGLLAFTVAACDDGISFCTNRDDAGQCPDFPDFPFDAGIDATTPPSDAAKPDAAVSDAATSDGASPMDAAADAAIDSGSPPVSLSVEDFCDAKYRVAKAWRDKLDQCCTNATIEDRSFFLAGGLLYEDGTGAAAESVDACVRRLNAAVGANLTFSGTAAVACANKFASQFSEPPAQCPVDGFDIDVREATIGKQSQELTQLAECRAALDGKLARNAACTDSYQCQAGLRCRGGACTDALVNGSACVLTEQCAEGLVCVGSSSGSGRVCRPKEQPVALTSACTQSVECDPGAFCSNNRCTVPTNRTICAQ